MGCCYSWGLKCDCWMSSTKEERDSWNDYHKCKSSKIPDVEWLAKVGTRLDNFAKDVRIHENFDQQMQNYFLNSKFDNHKPEDLSNWGGNAPPPYYLGQFIYLLLRVCLNVFIISRNMVRIKYNLDRFSTHRPFVSFIIQIVYWTEFGVMCWLGFQVFMGVYLPSTSSGSTLVSKRVSMKDQFLVEWRNHRYESNDPYIVYHWFKTILNWLLKPLLAVCAVLALYAKLLDLDFVYNDTIGKDGFWLMCLDIFVYMGLINQIGSIFDRPTIEIGAIQDFLFSDYTCMLETKDTDLLNKFTWSILARHVTHELGWFNSLIFWCTIRPLKYKKMLKFQVRECSSPEPEGDPEWDGEGVALTPPTGMYSSNSRLRRT